jgi:hypothetical protein
VPEVEGRGMRVYAHHDAEGNIRAFIIENATEGVTTMVAPKPGLFVTEIEGLDEKLAGDRDRLREIAKTHIVEHGRPIRKLAPKP